MKRKADSEEVMYRVQNSATKEMNVITFLKLRNILCKAHTTNVINYIKEFVDEYYQLIEDMPEEFYESIVYHIINDKRLLMFRILQNRNVYALISYLKYGTEDIYDIEEITPLQYYSIPKKHINRLVELLKTISDKAANHPIDLIVEDEMLWKLRRRPSYTDDEYIIVAYKMYLSVGLDNSIELLASKFGDVDYEKIHYLFTNIDVKKGLSDDISKLYVDFLFDNKKSSSNIMRQVLDGRFKNLFLNFNYFYEQFSNFLQKLGSKMPQSKVDVLLSERFLTKDVTNPNITGDIFADMVSSYYNRYDLLDTSEEEIHKRNLELYNEFLRNKYVSSIPMINLHYQEYLCETLKMSDSRNLVLGYRAGNCFRFNGEASILFRNFLKSNHMRLISISTQEYKDFAMVLVMRNGNCLIAQGIETSKWVPSEIKGESLYDACRTVLKQMMDYANSCGDNIVATIIGSSNTNVSSYNNNILPFLITPILENGGNYYNGIYNYQCLMDLKESCSLRDIKLYEPQVSYLDDREQIMRRQKSDYNNHLEIEKRLIALRFLRTRSEDIFAFYHRLSEHTELLTSCNTDWYITLFDDGTIDGFICSDDSRAQDEYEQEMNRIKEYLSKRKMNIKVKWLR